MSDTEHCLKMRRSAQKTRLRRSPPPGGGHGSLSERHSPFRRQRGSQAVGGEEPEKERKEEEKKGGIKRRKEKAEEQQKSSREAVVCPCRCWALPSRRPPLGTRPCCLRTLLPSASSSRVILRLHACSMDCGRFYCEGSACCARGISKRPSNVVKERRCLYPIVRRASPPVLLVFVSLSFSLAPLLLLSLLSRSAHTQLYVQVVLVLETGVQLLL